MPSSKKLKLTIPNGHLGQKSIDIFQKAYYKISGQDRSYRPGFSDPDVELRVLRPQEIPLYISDGIQDVGITGIDWITETGANVEEVLDLEFGGVKLVAATPKSQPYDTVNELMESFWKKGEEFRVSAEYLNITADYLKSQPAYKKRFGKKEPMIITPWWRKGDNPKAAVYLSFGATEAKPPEIVDMIVDVTETGTTLEQNNLKQIGDADEVDRAPRREQGGREGPMEEGEDQRPQDNAERSRRGPEAAAHLRQRQGEEPGQAPLGAPGPQAPHGQPALREGVVRRQHRDQQEGPARDAARP